MAVRPRTVLHDALVECDTQRTVASSDAIRADHGPTSKAGFMRMQNAEGSPTRANSGLKANGTPCGGSQTASKPIALNAGLRLIVIPPWKSAVAKSVLLL
jgi:hypothetical protein